MASAAGATVLRAGYLYKVGNGHKTWKRRWFVLTGTLVAYYTKPNGKLKGTVPLDLIVGVRRARTQAESIRKYVLLVTTADRVHEFQAGNSGERDEWIEDIQALLPEKTKRAAAAAAPRRRRVLPATPAAAAVEDGADTPAASEAKDYTVEMLSTMAVDFDDTASIDSSEMPFENNRLEDPRLQPLVGSFETPYFGTQIERQPVDPESTSWRTPWDAYNPPDYTHPRVLAGPSWADRVTEFDAIKFNQIDANNVDRTSFEGVYKFDPVTQMPLNPRGRTGLSGRGLLGKFGPNHAADTVVTRWAVDAETGSRRVSPSGGPVMEFVGIRRKDTGEWALPGGMVDNGETISTTMKREFGEEALNSLMLPQDQKDRLQVALNELFHPDVTVMLFCGVVDDHRNTDNAWMETAAVHVHDDTGDIFKHWAMTAGDDAAGVRWIEYDVNMCLYSGHQHFLALAHQRLMKPDDFTPPMVGAGRVFRTESLSVDNR